MRSCRVRLRAGRLYRLLWIIVPPSVLIGLSQREIAETSVASALRAKRSNTGGKDGAAYKSLRRRIQLLFGAAHEVTAISSQMPVFPHTASLRLVILKAQACVWREMAMSVYVDEGFRPCVTECATVAFRVCCDDRAQIFEVSAEALVAYCGAASKRKEDLLVAFEGAQLEILSVAAQKWAFRPTEPVRLGLDEFRMVRH
jgi:hypothetical protein